MHIRKETVKQRTYYYIEKDGKYGTILVIIDAEKKVVDIGIMYNDKSMYAELLGPRFFQYSKYVSTMLDSWMKL